VHAVSTGEFKLTLDSAVAIVRTLALL